MKRDEKLNTVLLGLGQRIKAFRKQKEMTQEEFANICGVARNNLSSIENGRNSVTDLMLYNLCKKFGDFDANYILTGDTKTVKTAVTEGVENF